MRARKPNKFSKVILLGPDFLGALANFRVLWVQGRFGSGKTALATILASWLVWAGYADDIIANYPTAVANPNPIPPIRRSVIVIDEGWQFAALSDAVEKYAGFLRKLGNFLILPSVFPVHRRFSSFSAERFFSFYVIGFPAWLFRWNLQRFSFRDRGYFLIINPHLVFNLYDTYSVVLSDAGIAELLEATYALEGQGVAPRSQRSASPPPPAGGARLDGLSQSAKEISEGVSALDEQLSHLAELIGRKRR